MRKLRNKLLLSILTVALTFIALGTTTFAWFTIGTDVTAEAFTATVAVAKGIEVAEKPTGDGTPVWGTSVKLGADVTIKDVSSTDGISFVKVNNESADGLYFTQTILIRTSDLSAQIKLSKLVLDGFVEQANYTHSGAEFGIDGKKFENNKTYIFDAYNALRVSFVTGKTPQDVQDAVKTAKVFEIRHTTTNQGIVGDGIMDSYIATNKDMEVLAAEPTALTTVVVDENGTPATDTVVIDFANLDYTENGNYYEAEFTVNVWLEGWDADCINALMGQVKTIGFELSATFTEQNS